jgi:hypothetical protein
VLATAVCAGAAAISLVELTVSTSPSTFDVSKTPRYYALIERAPRGILAEYPLARADQAVNSDYLFWQRRHHRPILNGAQLGSFPDEVGQAVADPASPETPGALSALGVTSIVTRPSTYQFTGGALGAPTLGAGYRRLGEADGATVWKVVARPAPAIAAFGPGFGGTETPPGHRASRWLGLDEGRVDLYASRAGTYVARFSVASFGRPRIVRLRGAHGGRRFVVPQAKTIAVPIRLKAGRSHLLLDARPGPQRIPDGRSVSVYVSNWGITRERNSLGAPIVPWRN